MIVDFILGAAIAFAIHGLYDHKRAIKILVERIRILEHKDG